MIKVEEIYDLDDSRLTGWEELPPDLWPFQHREWLRCWQKFLKGSRESLLILLARDERGLQGIVPLCHSRSNVFPGYGKIVLAGTPYFDCSDFLVTPATTEDVIYTFLSYLNNHYPRSFLYFSNIPASSSTSRIILDTINSKSVRGNYAVREAIPLMELPKGRTEFENSVERADLAYLDYQKNRLRKSGGFEFGFCRSLAEAKEALEDFFELHITRWESASGYSAYKFRPRRDFMRKLLEGFFPFGANIFFIMHKGKRIAACFAFLEKNRFFYYAPSFDALYAKFSPGRVLVRELVNYCIDNSFSIFDFGIGREEYKLQWPHRTEDLYTFYIYPQSRSAACALIRAQIKIADFCSFSILPLLRKITFLVGIWRKYKSRKGKFKRYR